MSYEVGEVVTLRGRGAEMLLEQAGLSPAGVREVEMTKTGGDRWRVVVKYPSREVLLDSLALARALDPVLEATARGVPDPSHRSTSLMAVSVAERLRASGRFPSTG